MKTSKNIASAARSHEFFVLRQRERFELFCEQCGTNAQFAAIDDAVLFSGLATREIVRLAEDGSLHSLETAGGHLFICRESLAERA